MMLNKTTKGTYTRNLQNTHRTPLTEKMSVSTENYITAEEQYKEFYGISPETDIGDDCSDSYIPTKELNDSHYRDLRILTKEIENLKSQLRQSNKSREMERDTIKELSEENEELKTSLQTTENYWKSKFENAEEEKDAHWNDWLNKEFGDELYPISPSPEPDEFVKKVKELQEENKEYDLEWCEIDNQRLTANALSDKLKEENESLKKSNKQKTKMIHKLREQVKTLEQRTMIYSILDDTYKSMPKSKKEWIDVNWKSIINGFADNLEDMVPDEESDDEQ
jgi:hypothetical protein